MSDGADNGFYYRSAGYVAADAGYTEETTSQSSFEGESGYYAATFHDGQLWVMNKNFEWIDPVSGDVRATGPQMDNATGGHTDLYINGSKDPTGYGLGDCSENGELPSRVASGCYQVEFDGGDIELYTDGQQMETIEILGGDCDINSLLALDSKDNLYCVEELDNRQQQLIRIDRNTGEALAITPETDQRIRQAIVSSNDEQVLFTASREDDLITAYVVAAEGGTEPRELSALSGQLSEKKLYSLTANTEETEPTSPEPEPTTEPETTSEDSEEASLDQAVGDYYRAAGAEEWAYTYDHLDSQAQSMFTEEEWSQKNQWFWDSNPTVYRILSINSDSASEEPLAEVEVRITGEDGSSWIRTTYFVLEDGEWKHRLSEAESDLFMPDATFEEFVEAQTGTSSDGGAVGVCAGISGCEPVDSADVDGDGRLDEIALVGEPDEYPTPRTEITVRVLLADGTTLTRRAAVEHWFGDTAWLGATDFGQVPGEEVVIGGTSGAHTRWYRVLTYRDGDLVELPYPDSDPARSDTFYTTMWPIDSALSVYMGVQCQTSNSTVVLRSASSVGAPSEDSAFEGEATSWVLEGGQWRMTDSRKLEYPDGDSASEIAGWQCGDLPRVYD